MSHQSPWAAQAMYLMQIPGFGVITAMTVLAAIGDISRFETPKHLVSYAGLAPGVEQSGTKQRSKPITKEGRKELRWAMVEVASPEDWDAVACRACRSALETALRRTQAPQARQRCHYCYRSSTHDRRLACFNPSPALPSLLQ